MRTIADHLTDITQNSIKAGAKNIFVDFIEDTPKNMIKFKIRDDGCGMDENDLEKIFDPFFTHRDHKIRKVGIGLSLLKENCELTGGYVKVESKKGKGTIVEALFKSNSIDIPPLGDLPSAFVSLITFSDNVDFTIKREYNNKVYTVDTKDLKEALGVSLREPVVYKELLNFIEKKEREIKKNA